MDMNIVKKNWLTAFYIFHIGWFAFGAIDSFWGKYIDGVFRMNLRTAMALYFFAYPLLNVIFAYFTYRFSLVEKGTKWLTSYMIILLVWILLVFDSFLANVIKDGYCEHQPIFHMLFQIFFIYIGSYYLYQCFQLRRLNLSENT